MARETPGDALGTVVPRDVARVIPGPHHSRPAPRPHRLADWRRMKTTLAGRSASRRIR